MDDHGVTIQRAEATDVDAGTSLTDTAYAPCVRSSDGLPLPVVEVHGLRIERVAGTGDDVLPLAGEQTGHGSELASSRMAAPA